MKKFYRKLKSEIELKSLYNTDLIRFFIFYFTLYYYTVVSCYNVHYYNMPKF